MAVKTNIANLPEGKYWTEFGYSQSYVWLEVRRTAKTATLTRVRSKLAEDWKPDFIPGGFAGHCTNQASQRYQYLGTDCGETTTIRMTKKGWTRGSSKFLQDVAREFYDYNF